MTKHKLYVRPLTDKEKERHRIKMGNSQTSEPTGVCNLWMATVRKGRRGPRRKIETLVLPNLPEPFIIGMTELKSLGILPKDWPNIANLIANDDYSAQAPSPMCEEERITNALLYAEGRDTMGDDTLEEDSPDLDKEEASPTTDPRCAIPDAHCSLLILMLTPKSR